MSSSGGVAESSSSSSPNLKWIYDVFISFRGEDTRHNFTSHLDMALRQRGVNFFIDDKLDRGGQISESLLKSIEGSRISIIILSENYASSTWCLDELVKIIECMKSKGQIVLPVFYKVDPSDVRKQTGGFGEALAKHEANKLMINKIQPWKEALTTVAALSGWDLTTRKNEADLIQDLVKQVLSILNQTQLLHVAKHSVGIDSQLRAVEELASHVVYDGVNMVGVYGIGGIGKTTLAKALYNKIAYQFEACCFLSNVREASEQFNGLVQLQQKLLNEILKDDLKVGCVHKGMNVIRDRLCSKKVLIVLDDVDQDEQLDALVGGRDWFGRGSKIIMTTRDRHLLEKHSFEAHPIQLLDPNKSLELFCWHAFKQNHPLSNFVDLSECAVGYCKGLPLALVILGSFLYKRERIIWKSKLDELKNSLEPGIEAVFQISYKGLQDKVKEIFLDISCFFVGEDVNCIKDMLKACDLNPDYGITILMDLSLVTVEDGEIQMHDLIRQMGQTIVCRESSEPQNRSRLWVAKEVIKMLKENSGSDAIKAIKVDLEYVSLVIDPKTFRKMKNLRLLILENGARFSTNILEYLPNKLKWIECFSSHIESPSLPGSTFVNDQLVGLVLHGLSNKHLGIRFENCEKLKHVDLSYSGFLEESPDFSAVLNLEKLYMRACISLKTIHESVGSLSKLTTLDLEDCDNLENLPSNLMLESLEVLNLRNCCKLEEISDLSVASNLKELRLSGCNRLRIIHDFFVGRSLDNLITLDLEGCDNLQRLPSYVMSESLEFFNLTSYLKMEICFDNSFQKFPSHLKLKSIKVLHLCDCKNLVEITNFSIASNLEILDLKSCFNLRMIHESVGSLDKLIALDISCCFNLEKLPSCLRLKSLVILSLCGCKKIEQLPEFDENMKSLRGMSLDGSGVKELPSSIRYLIGLENLTLSNCTNLITLPSEIHMLKNLTELCLLNCYNLDMFPSRSSFHFSQASLCSKLTILDLSNCNISNADFLETLSNVCTTLRELNLSGNKFFCLPSLHKFTSLRFLQLRNNKFLQNIAKLPHHLTRVNANGSELLVIDPDYIADIVFRQQEYEFGDPTRMLILMNNEIPKYFYNQTMESSISVSIQHSPNKRRTLVVCVVFKVDGDSCEAKPFVRYDVFINHQIIIGFGEEYCSSKSEYMLLITTPIIIFSSLDRNDQQNIDVSFHFIEDSYENSYITIRSHGAYVVDEVNEMQTITDVRELERRDNRKRGRDFV